MTPELQRQSVLHKLFSLQAYHDIQNLMGRYTVAINHRILLNVLDCFNLEDADVSIEVADEGLFIGKQAVETCVRNLVPEQQLAGEMLDIQLTSPIIEVAQDLKTARAQWVCPGIGAVPQATGEPQAIWNWGIVCVDFIYTNNSWRIWHLHWFRLIKCNYEDGWVRDTSMENRQSPQASEHAQPTTYHNPYSPTTIRSCIPAIPRPYRDASDNPNWMLDEDKSR